MKKINTKKSKFNNNQKAKIAACGCDFGHTPTVKAPKIKDLEDPKVRAKIAAKVAEDHKGLPKPQLLQKVTKETDPRKILLPNLKHKKTTVYRESVRWVQKNPKHFIWERESGPITFELDFTKWEHIPTKYEYDSIVFDNLEIIKSKGYSFSEEEAYDRLLIDIEKKLGETMIDLRYARGAGCCCPAYDAYCIVNDLYNTMLEARQWMEIMVPGLRMRAKDPCSVIPDLSKFELKNGEWVKKNPKPENKKEN